MGKKQAPSEHYLQGRLATGLGSSVDLALRKIYLIGEICEEMLYKFAISFNILDSTEGPINIIIASGGGHDWVGYAIYDLIKGSNNLTIIDGYGSIQSMAAIILQAGDVRRVSKESRFMIHNGSIELESGVNVDTLISIGDEVKRGNARYHAILAERTGMPIDKIARLCQDETYYSADEAIRCGFADSTVEKFPYELLEEATPQKAKTKGRK